MKSLYIHLTFNRKYYKPCTKYTIMCTGVHDIRKCNFQACHSHDYPKYNRTWHLKNLFYDVLRSNFDSSNTPSFNVYPSIFLFPYMHKIKSQTCGSLFNTHPILIVQGLCTNSFITHPTVNHLLNNSRHIHKQFENQESSIYI